jgi:MFS family permease
MLTVREPVRGASDAPAQAGRAASGPRRATLREGFAFLIRERAAFHYVFGPGLVSAGSSGLVIWSPPFLMRQHGMTLGEAGLWLAIASGVVTAAALAVAGPLASRYARGDAVRLSLLPIATVLLSIAAALLFLTAPGRPGVIAGLILFGALNWQYLSLGYTLLLGITPAWMRGTVLSIELIGANLLGYAGGPLIIGLVSDAVRGDQSLRVAMLAILLLYAWGALHLWLGRQWLRRRAAAVT